MYCSLYNKMVKKIDITERPTSMIELYEEEFGPGHIQHKANGQTFWVVDDG